MRIIKFIVLLFLVVNSCYCQSINKIVYSEKGGEMGTNTIAMITKDSIIIKYPYKDIVIKQATEKVFWDSLIKSITINDIKKIQSTKSVQEIDLIDTSLIVETRNGNYGFYNGMIDRIKNMEVYNFMITIENKLREMTLKFHGK